MSNELLCCRRFCPVSKWDVFFLFCACMGVGVALPCWGLGIRTPRTKLTTPWGFRPVLWGVPSQCRNYMAASFAQHWGIGVRNPLLELLNLPTYTKPSSAGVLPYVSGYHQFFCSAWVPWIESSLLHLFLVACFLGGSGGFGVNFGVTSRCSLPLAGA